MLVVPLLPACSLFDAELTEQQQVAKNWSETIRASQVLPVYPMTEDVQPGDVFAHALPINRQQEIYEKQGFLPLTQRVTRLDDLNHDDLYQDAYWKSPFADLPHARPNAAADSSSNSKDADLLPAPRASFPSFTFTVEQDGGLNLALPVQGIPLSLGIMGAQEANGTISIEEAYTYGVSGEEAYRTLRTDWWETSSDIRRTLMNMARRTENDLYLRVVTRVYFARRLNVSLQKTKSVSGNTALGTGATSERDSRTTELVETVEKMNELGGSATFHAVRRSRISFNRSFDRPVTIGFRAFDVKVLENGRLSVPIPSYTVLTEELDHERAFGESAGYTAREKTYERLRNEVRNHRNAKDIRRRILEQLSPYWQKIYQENPSHTRFQWLLAGYMESGNDRTKRMETLIHLIKQQLSNHGGTEP